ncbi:MAG: DNA polymerase I [Gammaproteobacteria bacterium RIFCSPHIGHO2_02_FULL_42_13]|nr:MAG: DNA polymerase I [Gammaproteobacteria bacterium RIFCSPHIGHO2_02_FULL_42_13]
MLQNSETPFILVDGSSYLHRAYHALPPLTNSKGQPTGAIYGVMKMLRSLIDEYHPKYIAVVFDAKGKTFRHDMYKEYKANRPPMPEDLICQIKPLHNLIRAMNIPLLMIDGVEADDVIGTLATQATRLGMHTIISTSDKDFAQLVNKQITLINTMSNTSLDVPGVAKKFGVPPELIPDYLALIGDTSDNVPGVHKAGPKTALKWLAEYGSLDKIIKHADEILGKVGENLRNTLDQLPLYKKLVTIKCDVPLDIGPKDLIDQPDDEEKLHELFQELEFKGWLSDAKPKDISNTSSYETISDEKTLLRWITKVKQSKLFAVDTETTSLNYMNAELVGISFAIEANKAAYLPLQHDREKQIDLNTALKMLKPILEDTSIKKIGQNIKYDKEIFANYDIDLQGIAYDTMLESYVIDSAGTRHNLDALALKYLNHKTITYEEITGKGAKQISFNQVDIATATNYAAEDADITLQLHQKLWPQLEKNKKLNHIFSDIEMPLCNVLARMERHGVLIDTHHLIKLSAQTNKRMKQLEEQIFKVAGTMFNLDSPKQLQEILYDKLGLPILHKTPKGQPSTAEDTLQELALNFPFPKYILEYRSLSKLKSTYIDRLPEQINAKTKRIHTSYNQAVTSTGRLSSSEPNLQNIPIRTDAGREIRQAFIAPKDYQILAADYSQVELRIMAHLSQDPGLLRAFSQDADIHKATAAEVFGIELNQVDADQRRKAKAINFGLIYGMSAFGLAKQLNVERVTAQAYINAYFDRYPRVKEFMQKTRDTARQQGYVETLSGRRLYVPNINAKNKMLQNAAERAAINAPMQGTAADIIKKAMIDIDTWLQNTNLKVHMLMQVHDELVFEIHKDDIEKAKHMIEHLMVHAINLDIPVLVDIGIGNNWDEAH